jgi:hypothetical protein
MGFRVLVSRHPAIRVTGLLAFAPAGLTPAERVSLHWTHGFEPVFQPRSPLSPSIRHVATHKASPQRQDSNLHGFDSRRACPLGATFVVEGRAA